LLLAESDAAATLAADLTAAGADEVITVARGATYAAPKAGAATVRPTEKADLLRLIGETAASGLAGVVYGWPLEGHDGDVLGRDLTVGLLHLVQSLGETGTATRVVVLTTNAQSAPDDALDVTPGQASLLGLVRVAVNEHADIAFRAIDVADGALDGVVDAILSDDAEDEVALRDGRLYVHRLERRAIADLDAGRPARDSGDAAARPRR
ncbi:hypothetical protein ACFQ4O_18145, partial [Methylopila musalis]